MIVITYPSNVNGFFSKEHDREKGQKKERGRGKVARRTIYHSYKCKIGDYVWTIREAIPG